MKNLLAGISLILIAMVMTSCGPTPQQAVDYNDKIIAEQSLIDASLSVFIEALQDGDIEEIEETYADAVKQNEIGTDVVSKMEDFDGKTDLKDAALKLFDVYKSLLENEYKEMVDIKKLPDNKVTDEVVEKWEDLAEKSSEELDRGMEILKTAQVEFSVKYRFTLASE